jgi:hypothetical protein
VVPCNPDPLDLLAGDEADLLAEDESGRRLDARRRRLRNQVTTQGAGM